MPQPDRNDPPLPRSVFEIAERAGRLHLHVCGDRAEVFRMAQSASGKTRAEFVRIATLRLPDGDIQPVGERRLTPQEREEIGRWLATRARGDSATDRALRLVAEAAEELRGAPGLSASEAESVLMALHFARLQVIDRLLTPETSAGASAAPSAGTTVALDEASRRRMAMGRFVEAEALLRQALKTSPHDAELHRRLAAALANQGRLAEARAASAVAVAFRPDGPEILRQGGHLALRAEDWDAAADLFARLAAHAPGAEAFRLLGRARFRAGRLDEAAEALAQAAALDPDDPRIHAAAGAVEIGRGNWAAAASLLTRATALNQDDADAWLHLARAHIEMADPRAAGRALAGAAATSTRLDRPARFNARLDNLETRIASLQGSHADPAA